jgi:hypothetical protein
VLGDIGEPDRALKRLSGATLLLVRRRRSHGSCV